jgi:anti-sigma B factor antagonist
MKMVEKIANFFAETRLEGATAVLDLHGEINKASDAALSAAYDAAAQAQPTAITLNFSNVDYINSIGIALIVGLLAKARAAHIPLTAIGLSDHYREIFTITRLSDFIDIQ